MTQLQQNLSIYLERRVLTLFALGFSSGLPLLLVFGTLSFWLREAGVSRTSIGFFSWVALAYGVKWLWSPLVDRLPLPWLSRKMGRRRSWMLFSQLTIMAALAGMAFSDPTTQLVSLALFALAVAFASATQDIVIDAYRIEAAPERLQGALAAAYMTGYRLAMIMAGAGALAIAAWAGSDLGYDPVGWKVAYLCMMGFMLVGVITCLLLHEPEVDLAAQQQAQAEHKQALMERGWPRPAAALLAFLKSAVVAPFAEFFQRFGWQALLILALIACYRISDVVMGVMANPFYVDMGFSKSEIATVTKVYGVIMTLVGAAVGGLLVMRFGTLRILMLGAVLAASTNLLFALMSQLGADLLLLTLIISLDNLSAGIATAAFITYLSSLTNVAFSATQYALFSSVMMLLPKFIAGFSGIMVDSYGYATFFIGTAAIGMPVLLLIHLVTRLHPPAK
ncbi:AmpG family muropeptide MFS transporter [Zobellella sp. CGMCC 1.18722]|uniref:AmpG family muropeptide MFS transporter n=1 Tax=Zobellella iuensis TaxID=2803811 RepID=A0ABS1QVA3_9GAMM|nr:AmpG family muropeptide MFS transporter [Zobellella iuensis]MBL1378785.1 AmpG family muropeptide MFS transporter [Zobellella iuensis]